LGVGCAATLKLQKRWEGQKHLDSAERLTNKKDYEGALEENKKIVGLFPFDSPGDSAMFNMGLIWINSDNPKKNYAKSLGSFQRILSDYPQSALAEEARVWTGVIKELILYEGKIREMEVTVNDLESRLNALKEIDIGIEEKKREDSHLK